MKKFLLFLLLAVFCFLSSDIFTIAEEIDWRFSNSQEAVYELEEKGFILSPSRPTKSRLDYALILSRLLDDIFSGKTSIDKETYSQLEILIEEFKDELKILKLRSDVSEYVTQRDTTIKSLSGRFVFTARNTISKPDEPSNPVTILPSFNFAYLPYKTNFEFNLSFKSTVGYLKVDEANVKYSLGNFGNIKFGRIYFLLGHLGLIGDNNFDAFEGMVLETFPNNILNFKGVYARLSSTNYPRERIFYDYDDYLATRISKDFLDKKLELGLNTLFSGIASEDAISMDFYWRFKNREFISEVAFYRPSKTTIEEIDPYEPRYAIVAGMDLINTKSVNVFLQLGDVQRGFTPMATSLVYSAQEHLYFDQNTRGFDIIFRYYPERKTDTSIWQTRPERTGMIPKDTIYELNIVGLWDDSWRKSHYRYVFRYITTVGKNLRFYLENNLWDREPTIVWTQKGVYNEARVFIVYEL